MSSVHVLAGHGTVTTIDGLAFLICDERGDIHHGPLGLMVSDTRHLSRYLLTIDEAPPDPLGASLVSANEARFNAFVAFPDHLDPPLEVTRVRVVDADGFDEITTLRWWGDGDMSVTVAVTVGCDFRDIFDVRRPQLTDVSVPLQSTSDTHRLTLMSADGRRETTLTCDPSPAVDGHELRWTADVGRGRPWHLHTRVYARHEGAGRLSVGPVPAPAPAHVMTEPPALGTACTQSLADLSLLTVADPTAPTRRLIAAGIPWFVALFGRDSLIASYQQRAVDPDRLVETLEALAARQGETDDPSNDEEPGKILHEVRFTERPWLGSGTAGGRRPYFGSVDATPLFLIMLGVAARWGVSPSRLRALLPSAERAMAWLRRAGERDGEGLIAYAGTGGRSLRNQGWKDSDNGIQNRRGQLPDGPIAVVEAQGYAYRAFREMCDLLAWFGDDRGAAAASADADRLRATIRERYWIPGTGDDPGYFALALDGNHRPVDAVASNMAHLLWCGVPSNEEADQVAEWLIRPELATGWGLRTLSSEMEGFNPISYHAGSVWPHDTALAIEGLRRYRHDHAALTLSAQLIEASTWFDGRLPELFGGHSRDHDPRPVPYPAACRPQAWAAGVPLSLVVTLLGIEPDMHRSTITVSPSLPPTLERMTATGLRVCGGTLSLDVDRDGVTLLEVPPGIGVELRSS